MLRPYLAGEWRALAVAAVSTVAVVAAYLARPFPLAIAVDRILGDHGGRPFELSSGDWKLLVILAGSVLLIALVNALGSHLADDRLENAAERIVHRLRVATYSRLQRLSLAFHDRQHTGDLVRRVTGDVEAVGSLFSNSLGTLASSGILLAGMLIVSLIIDPLLALTAFAAAPVLALAAFRFAPRARYNAQRQRAALRELASLSGESISSMRAVKALGAERFEEERLERKSEEIQGLARAASRVEGRFSGIIDTLGAIALALVIVVGVLRVAAGAVSAGELIVMYTYARRIDRPLRALARGAAKASRSLARAESVAEVLAAEELEEDRPGAYRGPRARGELELRDVSFAYVPDRPAITELSLRVDAGQKVALVGPPGAGKSTVAALMARLYDPSSGQVLIDGRDARDCAVAWLREQFGLVLQETILFTGTVAENIAYGLEAEPSEVVSAAEAAGAHEFISQLPEGYDTDLGPRGVGLSGGQRQRIAIARTLLRDPPILVLDEPTTGLDAESEASVLEGLEGLMRDRTTVIIAHSPALAAVADRGLAMEGGRIVADGPAQEVLRERGHAEPRRPRRRAPRPMPAGDEALPRMPLLLDSETMAGALRRSLGDGGPLPDVRVRYLRYKPATNLVVHYDVRIGGGCHGAFAMIAAQADLRRRAGKPENVMLAEMVDGRSPAPKPLSYDPELEALIQWFPLDLSLPALAEPPERLRSRIERAGLDVGEIGEHPEVLAYKPRRRAVLRVGEHVLKVYRHDSEFGPAVDGLNVSSGLPSLRTPVPEAVVPQLRLTVQSALPGVRPGGAAEVAHEAGALLRRLHATEPPQLPRFEPRHQLEAAAAACGISAIADKRLRRVQALLRELEERMPDAGTLVPSHGDFNSNQILELDGELGLVDFDRMCAAPPALDPANYAAKMVGAPRDLAAGLEALEALLDGYGPRPDDMSWYLATAILRRSTHPFRYFEEHWPERVEGMVLAAESVLHA
jgi:ABC-type multidrug transport system fused ATPase/permease subunit